MPPVPACYSADAGPKRVQFSNLISLPPRLTTQVALIFALFPFPGLQLSVRDSICLEGQLVSRTRF